MDIETVAEKTPHLIFKEEVDPKVGLLPFQARRIAFNLGLRDKAYKEMVKFVTAYTKPMKVLMLLWLKLILYSKLRMISYWQLTPK